MKTFLVTGASGYIGSHMCYELRQFYPDCKIIAVDKVKKNKLNHLYDEFVLQDIARSNFWIMDRDKIDCIFHFAALASVPDSEANPTLYYQNNLMSSMRLLDEAVFFGIRNFVFSSSCAVYGPSPKPIREIDSKNPISVYARTKSVFEDILWKAELEGNIRAGILRYFNAAGRNVEANLYEEHDPETHLIPNLIKNDVVKIFGTDYNTPDGTAIRDYIHVVDVCQAHIKTYEYMEKNRKGITCNIGTGKGNSVLEVIELVERITGISKQKEYFPKRPGDAESLVSNVQRMKNILTFEPKHDIISIIESMTK